MKKIILMTGVSLMASQALMAGGDVLPLPPVAHSAWSLGAKIGTLGIGVDASRMISDKVAIRFNVNGLQVSDIEESIEGIDYSVDLNLFSAGALLDYYPIEDSSFRVSAGAYYNDNNVEATATNTGTITIDGVPYANTVVDSVNAKFTSNQVVPYLGVGWSRDTGDSGWSFSMDIGAFYHGDPDVDVTTNFSSTATPAEITAVKNSVANYKKTVLDTLSDYKVYPVIMVGATYRF